MLLNISIVTYQTDLRLLAETLDSLETALAAARQEGQFNQCVIYVVDNGNQAEALHAVLEEHITQPFTIINAKTNLGFGKAHNQAILNKSPIETISDDYHLILNPDLIIGCGALSAGIEFLQSNGDVAIAGPVGFDSHGKPAYLAKRQPSIATLLIRAIPVLKSRTFGQTLLERYEYRDLDTGLPQEVELLSGCFMLARKSALQKIGGFDESFFLYFEDYDLCMRIKKHGKVIQLPSMEVVHHGGNASLKGLQHILMFARSMCRYFTKWGWNLTGK